MEVIQVYARNLLFFLHSIRERQIFSPVLFPRIFFNRGASVPVVFLKFNTFFNQSGQAIPIYGCCFN
jgi:hypothetical protein